MIIWTEDIETKIDSVTIIEDVHKIIIAFQINFILWWNLKILLK